MPREACRLVLRVKAVRREPLQNISDDDLLSEGIKFHYKFRKDFITLWNSLNAKRGYSWESNPEVTVVEFERVEG
jgi:hypothetical protein